VGLPSYPGFAYFIIVKRSGSSYLPWPSDRQSLRPFAPFPVRLLLAAIEC
jgi:hypothetical protein